MQKRVITKPPEVFLNRSSPVIARARFRCMAHGRLRETNIFTGAGHVAFHDERVDHLEKIKVNVAEIKALHWCSTQKDKVWENGSRRVNSRRGALGKVFSSLDSCRVPGSVGAAGGEVDRAGYQRLLNAHVIRGWS